MPEQTLAVAATALSTASQAVGQKRGIYLGRHVFGFAAVLFGIISFVWHDLGAPWQQIRALGNLPHREILVYTFAVIELVAGIAVQWKRTVRSGALALGIVFLAFGLLWVPQIITQPLVYNWWGSFFEQFSIFSGALILYASTDVMNRERGLRVAQLGFIFFGICTISFTLEQLFYLSATASFVPKWIPPGQMFWAVATTIAFALAAIALLSGRFALLAAQLTTAMIVGFGLLIWLPFVFGDPHKLINWAGNAQNLAIAGAAWIVTDYLRQNRIANQLD